MSTCQEQVRPPAAGRWRALCLRPLAALWLVGALMLPSQAGALPGPGEQVPSFAAKDLLDRPHKSQEWRGRRTLLVVMTDRNVGDEMRRWFDAAATRIPEDVHRASIISLGLPFYVSTGMVRSRAKEEVPREFWEDTWLDKDRKMAQVLGLATSRQPYVLVLDEQGTVLASVHGTVDSPDARSIWEALPGSPR